MAEKGVSLSVTWKDVAIESDKDFNSLLDETLVAIKDKISAARIQAVQSKNVQIGPSLAEKGIGVSVTIDF